MFAPRGRGFTSHTITTKTLIAIIVPLITVAAICTALIFPRALAATIVSDNFNDNSLDTTKWVANDVFSGFTNTNVSVAETSQRLEIGPLLQNVSGSSYNGIRTANSYDFSDAYAFVELVQAAASNTAADGMFTVGNDVNAYYRLYVECGTRFGQRKTGATKTTLFSTTYDSVNHRFLRIRHVSATGNVTLDTAPGSGGVPGTWVQRYSETWNSSISTASIVFELKGGTWQVESNAPGKVIFDNFEVADNSTPTVTAISPNSGTTSGGTSVTITGTGFLTGATVTLGGTAATNVTVVSSTSITATTPAHAAGTVDVVVTNTDSQSGTLTNGFTYSAGETVILSDDFNDNSLDTTKWVANDVFSGFTNTNVAVAETSQRLEIGPLLQNVSGSSYNGIRTVNSFNFSGAYTYVELVQAAASNTAADAMFTVGNDVNAYYRMYVEGGTLFGQRKIGATKTTLFSTTYDSVNHRFLRIRHVSATGNVTLDTAPGSSGVPGTWVQRYSETWNSSISTASIVFELKGGTWQVESNAPGKVIFDNFEVADNSTPTVTAISPSSGTTSGGTSVTITGTGFLTGATVTLGGTAATNVTVVSSTSITATTPAHAAGTVDVVVTNTDSQSGTLTNGFTYSAGETVILSDDFNDNSLDTTKWVANDVFSGFTNTNVAVAETSQRLEIGPLLQNVSGSSYNGIRTVNSFNFSGAYTYVELVQAAASNTAADAMFTVGNDVNAYYRMYVEGGTLFGQRKIGATKTTLFSTTYDSVNHRFLRIRHVSATGNVTLDTAPGSSGAPGTWVERYTETWHSSISTSAIRFELKGGTWQVEANAPGKVIFDNFHAAVPGSGSGNGISNINVVVTCNTSVLVNFHTSAASRAFIEYGPTTSYGSSTIDDPVRFYTEHAIQLTGLSANTTYHFRINANSNGITQSADLVVTTTSSGATCPALPVQVDSRMPDMTGAVEYFVKADCTGVSNCFTNFQTALNTAGTDNGKRFITVDAGLTLVNQWLMPANTDQNWIIIRSSAHASLPEGKRVSPSNASNMFKIQNNNVDPPIVFAAGSNHIRIIGAEITIDPAALANAPTGANQGGLINFESNVTNQASLPKFIGVDRSYVHGWPNKNTGRGAFVMGEDLFFIDNYFYDFHFSGFDGQAILGLDVKRWKILNNTLVGTSENFMWGGDGLRIDGYVIGELEYLRNHMYVP